MNELYGPFRIITFSRKSLIELLLAFQQALIQDIRANLLSANPASHRSSSGNSLNVVALKVCDFEEGLSSGNVDGSAAARAGSSRLRAEWSAGGAVA